MLAALLLACTRPDGRGRPVPGGDRAVDSDPGTREGTGESATPPHWVKVDAGGYEAAGLLSDGRLVFWGQEDMFGPPGPFVDFDLNNYGGCGVTPEGRVTCWCPGPEYTHTSCEGLPTGTDFVAVENGETFACAQRADRTVTCWGEPGQTQRSRPRGPVRDWSMDLVQACAALDSGEVTCWGNTRPFGMAGPEAALAPPAGLDYTQVAVGRTHACALDSDGAAHCWGSASNVVWPLPDGLPGPWVELVGSNLFTCGIREDRTAACWHAGADAFPFLDAWDGPPPDEKFQQIGTGEWSSCGLTLDGRIVCWDPEYAWFGEQSPPDLADL